MSKLCRTLLESASSGSTSSMSTTCHGERPPLRLTGVQRRSCSPCTPRHRRILTALRSSCRGRTALWLSGRTRRTRSSKAIGCRAPRWPLSRTAWIQGRSRSPSRDPPDVGPWELLYVGQLIPGKGVELLLTAVAELRTRHNVRLGPLVPGPHRWKKSCSPRSSAWDRRHRPIPRTRSPGAIGNGLPGFPHRGSPLLG